MSTTEATDEVVGNKITIDGELILLARCELERVASALDRAITGTTFIGRSIQALEAAEEAIFEAVNTCNAYGLDGAATAMQHPSSVDVDALRRRVRRLGIGAALAEPNPNEAQSGGDAA